MKKMEIRPNGPRVNNIDKEPKNTVFIAASVISPVIIYHYLNVVVIVIAAMILSGGSQLSEGANAVIMHNNSLSIAMAIKILALLVAVAPLVPAFISEKPVIRPISWKGFAHTVVLGIVLPIFANVLFYLLGITGADKQYAQVQANQFSLPILGGVLLYGIITPVCEEIVNRGLVYNRVRKYSNVPVAVILSALIFGISHGNVAQFLYGFILGCVIAVIYEKQGSFIYPVLFHAVANTVVYVAMSIDSIKALIMLSPVWMGCGILSVVVLAIMLKQQD